MAYYVYLLRCLDDSIYCGITNDPYNRFIAHGLGKGAKYTRAHGVKRFEKIWLCKDKSSALKIEYKLKKLTRDQKLDLINGNALHEDVFDVGADYHIKLKTAFDYLKKDYLQNVDIIEALNMGLGLVVDSREKGVCVYLPDSYVYFISTDDGETLNDLSDDFSKPWFGIVTHHLFERDILIKKYDLEASENCYNVAYLKEPPEPLDDIDIRPLFPIHIPIVDRVYSLYDAHEEVERLVKEKKMLGAFIGDTLVGFAGFHSEGAMGMLEVLPEYRRKGYGKALSIQMIRLVLSLHRVPFAQIFYSNTPSINMQKQLGYSFSSPEIVWMHKKEQ